jgi:UPF0755 protein
VSRRDYRRYGSPRRRAGRGRTLVWLVLIIVMAGAVALAARNALRSDPAPVPSTASAPVQKLLIREGLRREDVAALLDKETGISGARYLELTAAGARGRALAHTDRPTTLEGFLFPATYDITKATSPRQLVDEQLAAYRDNTAGVDYSYAKARPVVAAVIYNRLKAGMRLDIDATVQFAIGSWKAELTAADLAVDSPYNTRRFTGLPPGPIASPGADSIQAAAHPAKTPFIYYVARNDGTGRHFFSTTPAQFEIDVQRSRANAG